MQKKLYEVKYRKEAIQAYIEQKRPGLMRLPFPKVDKWFACLCLIFCLIGLCFLAVSYSKKASVSGVLVPDKGLSNIYSPANGAVSKLYVKIGDQVKRGEKLLSLNVSSAIKLDESKYQTKLVSIEAQIKKIDEKAKLKETYRAEYLSHGKEKIAGLNESVRAKNLTYLTSTEKVHIAESRLASYKTLVSKNLISKKELEDIELEMITYKLDSNTTHESLLATREELRAAVSDLDEFEASSRIDSAELELSRYKLLDELDSLNASSSFDVFSPVDGKVIALQIHEGERVGELVMLASILPSDSKLVAKLFIDAKSIGHIRAGQLVKISFIAFPRADYGSVEARLTQKGDVMLKASEINSPIQLKGENYFLSTAELSSQNITVSNEKVSFQPGMEVEATIVLDTKRIYEWLLRPIFEKLKSLS
ncbi:MAG: HlyD family efflux transporter periplasmic adaptor subunit [Gammaproteobacteria bacterium]|nr:MAG: HlyD family efflux transporter periplasmic adaptor subunit [Gammaproteobacteria bacterium]